MVKLQYCLASLLLCAVAPPLAAQAQGGTIRFHGAIVVQPTPCQLQVRSSGKTVRAECDPAGTSAAGSAVDPFRLGAQPMKIEAESVTLKGAAIGQKDRQGYIVTLTYR